MCKCHFQANRDEDDHHLNDISSTGITNASNLNEHLNDNTPHDSFSYNIDQFNDHMNEDCQPG